MKPLYQRYVEKEFKKRTRAHAGYSLRRFAKSIGLEASNLSQILNSKRIPSFASATKLYHSCDVPEELKDKFYQSILEAHVQSGKQRIDPRLRALAKNRSIKSRLTQGNKVVGFEDFSLISDWFHYAILELSLAEDIQPNPFYLARRLGIHPVDARGAIDRLMSMRLLTLDENGYLRKNTGFVTTAKKNHSSKAHQKHQKQMLRKAMEAMDLHPVEKRSHNSMTMAIDPLKIPQAKELITKFIRELNQYMVIGSQKKVYQLNVALFPLELEG